jgi:hypothetical protein
LFGSKVQLLKKNRYGEGRVVRLLFSIDDDLHDEMLRNLLLKAGACGKSSYGTREILVNEMGRV